MANRNDAAARAAELWRTSEYRVAVTDFLTPGEKLEVYTELCARIGNGIRRCFFWGGCRGTERGAAVFLPEWCMPEEAPQHAMPLDEERTAFFAEYLRENPAVLEEIPIVPLSVRGSGFRELSHRDFMGGILSLGVDRAVIGDIAVLSGSEALVFAADRIAPFLEAELTRIGRDAVTCVRIPPDPCFLVPRRYEEIPVTVASLRLDGLVKALTGQSRENAAETVRAGLVEVNYRETDEASRPVAEGDILSGRGYGKYIVGAPAGSTKSGRIRLVCRKYL
jgi:RNA-binding protein YlmH